MASDQYRAEVEKLLYQFAEKGLKPPQDYIDSGLSLGQAVFNKLKEKSKFSVAEVRFAGSIAKKTDVVQPDLDLIAVINDCRPPFMDSKILEDFEDILILNQGALKIRPNSISRKPGKSSIQFQFTNAIEVDLLPAANLEPEEIYVWLNNNPDDYYSYSSSLVGRTLKFMTSHESSFVHVVVRLAKFWFKSLTFEKDVSGGSTIMELIGIAAAEKEEARALNNQDKLSIVRAFADVLDMISKLGTLKLAFREVKVAGEMKWEQIPVNQLPSNLARQQRFIIEPANPFNDLLEGKKDDFMEKFMKFARVTRDRLSNLMAGHYATFDGTTNVLTVNILKLVEPQPGNLKVEFPSGVPDHFQIAYASSYPSPYCDMKVRNEEPLKREEVKWMIEVLKRNLCTAVKATVGASLDSSGGANGTSGNGKKVTTKDVANAVEALISKNLSTNLAPARDREEEMDATLTIPYDIDGQRYAVKFSMSWNKNHRARAF